MPYKASKIYYDGSHYIAVPKENFPSRKGRSNQSGMQTDSVKAKFEAAYAESQALPKRERKQYIAEKLQDDFATAEEAKEYTRRQTERKRNNACKRYTRLWRKVYLQGKWDYFVTLTYDNDKHTEESFRQSLRNTLKHLVSRKGWKYIGVWERGGETGRLHFHGIFYIPPNGMVGEIVETKDYNTKDHRMQTAHQNTYFLERYGRNDFQALGSSEEVQHSLGYLMKYIEKSGERLIYGGDLPTYFESDVADEDILAPYGIDDRKVILADDFTCMVDGEVIGKVSPEVIAKMPKAN